MRLIFKFGTVRRLDTNERYIKCAPVKIQTWYTQALIGSPFCMSIFTLSFQAVKERTPFLYYVLYNS